MNAGMAIVIPSWAIMETLNLPELANERREMERRSFARGIVQPD